MKYIRIFIMASLAIGLLLGCDTGSDNDSSNDVKLPVAEDTPASELTDEEAQKVCAAIYDVVSGQLESAQKQIEDVKCLAVGIMMTSMTIQMGGSDTDIAATCNETKASCENGEMDDMMAQYMEGVETEEITEEDFCDGASEGLEDCDATTGEVADCVVAMFNTQMTAMTSMFNDLPQCSELTSESLEQLVDSFDNESEPETPEACKIVEQKCPKMMEDM
ncbi:MAG: hypothetical protein JXR76_23475 [Deltaproteobacteria bacterium]|nr:hypothetical protein [Deltaproteobacteria bacterium]